MRAMSREWRHGAAIRVGETGWTTTPGDADFFVEYQGPRELAWTIKPTVMMRALLWLVGKPLVVEIRPSQNDSTKILRATLGLTALSFVRTAPPPIRRALERSLCQLLVSVQSRTLDVRFSAGPSSHRPR